jgi:hypothetical protein
MKAVEETESGAVGTHRVDEEGELLERLLRGLRLDEGIPLSILPDGDERLAESIRTLVADEFLEPRGNDSAGFTGATVADSDPGVRPRSPRRPVDREPDIPFTLRAFGRQWSRRSAAESR